jgi:hypothetical protein
MTKYFLLVLVTLFLFGCKDPTGPVNVEPPVIIPPTEARGSGGHAYMAGDIRDYIHRSKVVTNTNIYVMNQQDYTDTLAHVFITSANASFKITDLPEGRVDLIFMNENYLCAKIGKLNLKANGNCFYNPYSDGFFIDSTAYMTNMADSVGRPDAPEYGLQGYGPALGVYFKWETVDSLAWEIVRSAGCDTLAVYRYDDPVFDPYENDVYILKCTSIKLVSEKLKFFNWLKEIKEAGPSFQVVQQ